MVLGHKSGQTMPSMKVNGVWAWLTEKESSTTQQGIITKENGDIIKHGVEEFIKT